MRRVLSWIGIILAGAGFILLCLSWVFPEIKFVIPLALIVGALILLFIVKRMGGGEEPAEKSAVTLPKAAFESETEKSDE